MLPYHRHHYTVLKLINKDMNYMFFAICNNYFVRTRLTLISSLDSKKKPDPGCV